MTNSNEDEVILIREEEKEGSERLYQTMFLKSAEEGGELEFLLFRKLDDEFNKVNSFYSMKVKQVMEEAEELNNQMNALIALRVKVHKVGGFRNLDSNGPSTSNTMEHHVNDESHSKFHQHLDVIQEVEMSSEGHVKDESGNRAEQTASKRSIRGFIPPSLRILDHVKINLVEHETAVSTVKGLLTSSTSELSFSKQELTKAEEQLSKAFKEFYTKLRLLKCYSFLNLLAFSKIMKKYNKVCSRNASKEYLKMVDNSYVGSSDDVL